MDSKELECPRNPGASREMYLPERFHTMLTSCKTDQEPGGSDWSVMGRTTPWLSCLVKRAFCPLFKPKPGVWTLRWTWLEPVGHWPFPSVPCPRVATLNKHPFCFSLLLLYLAHWEPVDWASTLSVLQDTDFDPNNSGNKNKHSQIWHLNT